MPNRRMFSRKICRSAKFLKMPGESQRLYFHLGLDTDDDGVVEAYSVMQAAGISEEFFNILVEKGYVIVLNDDLVSYMTDWREHNVIRADRKVDSIYKELLLEKVPGIKLVEPRKRASSRRKKLSEEDGQTNDSPSPDNGQTSDSPNKNEKSGQSNDRQMADNGQTDDSPMTDNGQHKTSKVKTSKDNLEKENLKKENTSEDNLSESNSNKVDKDYKKLKIIFENSLEDITEENINECINYLNYLPVELIEYALIKTGMVKNPNWQYTKVILNSWLAKGINTLQKVKQDEKDFKKNNRSVETDSNDPSGFKRKGEELLNDE